MRRYIRNTLLRTALVAALFFLCAVTHADTNRFNSVFDSTITSAPSGDTLSLDDALSLVARSNPALRVLDWQQQAAQAQLRQAGLRPNPELAVEFEEVGWDAPGFSESEISLSLSQELELFGQRGARKALARVGIDATRLQGRFAAYDIYLDVKSRFYVLAHAQSRLQLSDSSVATAMSIVDDITMRIEKGAALQSELLLARLELQRVQLAHAEATLDRSDAEIALAALWGGEPSDITVPALEEPSPPAMFTRLSDKVDSTRGMLQLQQEAEITRAERRLATTEARPNLTFSTGVKHLRADGSNSLLFGIALPLPLFNRNQGAIDHFDAQARSLEYERLNTRNQTQAELLAGISRLQLLHKKHSALDTLMVPTAEDAYRKLKQAYEAGRLPYTGMLEVQRTLNELRFEHNDILLEIHEQIISLDRITGINMQTAHQ